MKNIKHLINKLENLKGASFVAINNYEAKTTGEIANHLVNLGISIENAKQTDLNRLNACNDKDIQDIAFSSKIDVETVKLALSEMIVSATKNLSADKTERTNQSQAQTDAFIFVTSAIRIHKDTLQVHIFGQAINKTVLVKGEYKTVNSSNKTLAKKAIKKHLDLRTDKFRDFILSSIDSVVIAKETIEIQ